MSISNRIANGVAELAQHVQEILQHRVGGGDDLGVRRVSLLSDNQLGELVGDIGVGSFQRGADDGSGQALYGKAGTIVGSSLEGSNTDIADEFTKLIVTQQAYSANTKVITTSNTMVQDLLNVLR